MMHAKFLGVHLAHSEYSLHVYYHCLPECGLDAGDAVVKSYSSRTEVSRPWPMIQIGLLSVL